MTLQCSVESLYVPMGCVKIPVEQTIENDYEVMNKLEAPRPIPAMLDSYQVVANEVCCKAKIVEVKVFNSIIEKTGNLYVDHQVKSKKSYDAKNQQLEDALGKLINQQVIESEEPVYAYIDEKRSVEGYIDTVHFVNRAVYYENVQFVNNSDVIEPPPMFTNEVETTDKDTTLDIAGEVFNGLESIPVRRPGFHKIFHKGKCAVQNLESVLEFDEDEGEDEGEDEDEVEDEVENEVEDDDDDDDDSQGAVSLETDIDPDELDSRLTEMQDIVDRMTNVTPPPETADPTVLSSVVATTPPIVPDDQIGNSTNTLRDILNARDLGRRENNADTVIFNLSISVAIFISFLIFAFIIYCWWLQKQ